MIDPTLAALQTAEADLTTAHAAARDALAAARRGDPAGELAAASLALSVAALGQVVLVALREDT